MHTRGEGARNPRSVVSFELLEVEVYTHSMYDVNGISRLEKLEFDIKPIHLPGNPAVCLNQRAVHDQL